MDDIEDVVVASGRSTNTNGRMVHHLVPRTGRSATSNSITSESVNGSRTDNGHSDDVTTTTDASTGDGNHLPGFGTIFVHTFGCGHNVSDGEYMAGQLSAKGYTITDAFYSNGNNNNNSKNGGSPAADCYLINSCTVKNPSEDHFVTMLRRAQATNKPVVVAGCVPQGDPTNAEWGSVSMVGVNQIDRVVEVVEQALRGNVVRCVDTCPPKTKGAAGHRYNGQELPRLDLPKIRRNQYIEIIPINVGCLNNCTYCKTKHARGDLRSWSIAEVVQRVRDVVRLDVREVRLTSEDTGAYGLDIGTNAAQLIQEILKEVEGTTVMIRVGMSNPPYLLKQLDEFVTLFRHPNLYAFLHIPVQSGSNAVLDAMAREYTVEDFMQCVTTFRERVSSGISIATDIICAFPGEGDTEWEETMELCRQVQFPVLNISRFYSRRGTPAASMPQIPTAVSKQRSVEITQLYNSYTTYDALLETTHKYVSLLEHAHDKKHLVGHTKDYVQILIPPSEARLGDCVDVVITTTNKFSVSGKVLHNHGPLLVISPQASSSSAAACNNQSNNTSSSEVHVSRSEQERSSSCCAATIAGCGCSCGSPSSSKPKKRALLPPLLSTSSSATAATIAVLTAGVALGCVFSSRLARKS